jgi:hypothetical protein
MKVKLEKPYDPSRAKVTFHYNASVPRLDPYGINETVTDGVSTYEIAKRGLRLWKVDGYQRDNGNDVTTTGGHFIPSATAIPWSAIAPPAPSGGSIPDETTLYLEFVDLPTGKTHSKEDIVYTIREEGVPEAGKGYIKTNGVVNPAYFAEKESPDGLCVNLLQPELDVIADADNDGMDDDWELANELDPADPEDASYDYDEDWISNLYEYLLGFDPWNDSTGGTFDALADRDGDGVSDMDEAMLGEWIWDTALERYAFIRRLDWEIHDANDDSDEDGVGKYDELLAGTDPYKADTDGDRLLDGWEIANNLNPNDDGTGNINNGGSGDPDNDGLTNAQEQQLGTDPNDPDADGDGMSDSLEIAAGTGTGNQDSDGDGIPDSIDTQPLVSALAFTDADRDGIPDGNDANPNEARGPAPSIASETVSGNPVSNLIQDETVKFVFMVSNPGGPAPSASNLTFFLNGIADTAQTTSITAIGSPVGSSQRFLLTWLAKTTANYPALTLQNLTLRFRDSQHATSWINLARIDVAEWEGMIAGIPDQILDASDADRWVAKVASHLNGRKTSPFELAGSHRISGGNRYRGPLAVKLLDADGRTEKGMAVIPSGVRYPMMVIKRQSASMPLAASRIVDISSPEVIPARCIGYLNKSGYKVTMTVPNDSVTLMPNEMKFKSLPDQPETPDNMYSRLGSTVAIVEGEEGLQFHDRYVSAPDFSLYSRTLHMGIFENNPEPARDWPLFENYGLFISLEKSITPHAAGSLEYPGLPQPRGNLENTAPLLMAAEQWHKIVLKAGPDTAALSNGIQLKIGSGVNGDEAPQSGFALQVKGTGGLAPLTIPPDGKIPLTPTSGHYTSLISPAGLTVFLKRGTNADQFHRLSLNLIPKPTAPQPDELVRIAALDLLPVDIEEVISDQIAGNEANKLPTTYYGKHPNNPMLMATRTGTDARLMVKMNVLAAHAASIRVGVRLKGQTSILNSAASVAPPGKTSLSFTALNGTNIYDVVAGYDANSNAILDPSEVTIVFQKTPKIDPNGDPYSGGDTTYAFLDKILIVTKDDYVSARTWTQSYDTTLGLFLPTGTALMGMFATGATSAPGVSSTEWGQLLDANVIPSTQGLSHPLGAKWNTSNEAHTFKMVFPFTSPIAGDLHQSTGIVILRDRLIDAIKGQLLPIATATKQTSAPIPFSDDKINFEGSDFRTDLHLALGKCRAEGTITVIYSLTFDGSKLFIHESKIDGYVTDLYDWAYGTTLVLPILGQIDLTKDAARTQAGHATLTDPGTPNAGRVFFTNVEIKTGWQIVGIPY